jgi:ribose transport system permease protein
VKEQSIAGTCSDGNEKFRIRDLSFFRLKESGILIGFVALLVFFSFMSPQFMTLNNIINIIRQISILGIMAVGMTMVIVSGEIDLSVGSVFGLSAMVVGICMTSGIPIIISALIGLATGTLCGIINGFIITYLKVPAFIVTLGMLNIARGTSLMLTGGLVVTLTKRLISDPMLDAFVFMGRGKLFAVLPTMSVIFFIVLVIGFLIYEKSLLGFRIRAVGGNADSARVTGIKVKKIKIISFAIMGFLCALGGILNLAFLNNVQGTMGQGQELDVIAATILGGASLSGGEGTMLGTLIGVFTLGVLRNGLVLIGVSPFLQMIVIGVVLVGAVVVDMNSKEI